MGIPLRSIPAGEGHDEMLKTMTFEFFGSGKHKISPSMHLTEKNSLFLDVRSNEELAAIAFSLVHHMPVLHIPINEIPERISEIPRDKTVGVFCSSDVRSTMVYFYLRARAKITSVFSSLSHAGFGRFSIAKSSPYWQIRLRFHSIGATKSDAITGQNPEVIFARAIRALGFDNVRIIEGGYVELVEELKPGKLLKHISKNGGDK